MRGGKREGAGRPEGSPNKATAARQQEIADSGMTPLDYLLSVMRDPDEGQDTRLEAAKAAAPYVHPKLASIQHAGTVGFMTHEDWLDELDKLDGARTDYHNRIRG
ncbi:hypothetical protein DEM27_28670 [Metarhizobium album]|uniref:Uncharacterized protein n=2 Tax=Metarhizobium album TaxID=2182425 RepID=A0A2U2DHU6_9HYPH|nr:hypothetical protein DEM27_28670 [Rhizobium album]